LATYVLVPGAWLGGWAWRDVTARLRPEGHEVYPITLTGLGEREHLARPEIDLETHIADVVNTITWNDLDDIVLAGHSYAGIVVTGVADRIPERLSRLVYVDSAPFADGMSMISLFPPEARAGLEETVTTFGDGWRLPFPGFEALAADASIEGISDEQKAFVASKASAQPWRTWTDPLKLANGSPATYERVLIACGDMLGAIAAGIPEIVAMTSPPWGYFEIHTGHWPMFSTPGELAGVLGRIGGRTV
jgi:pimeloyl-ACP methyl ester carboxylesterase